MHSIWKRFIYFGIGLGIGLTLVLIIFGTRGCNWLPENRIKASILSKVVLLDTSDMSYDFNSLEYMEIVSKGGVDLSLSMRKAEPKSYYFSYIDSSDKMYVTQATFQSDGIVALLKPINENEPAKSHINDVVLPIIHLPGDSSFISFHDDISAEVARYSLSRQSVFRSLQKSGKARAIPIDHDPENRPIHAFLFEFNGVLFKAHARIFQSSLEFLFIEEFLD